MGNARDDKYNTKPVTIRLHDSEHKQFKTLCHREELPMAVVIKRAVMVEVKKLKKKYPGVCHDE